MKDKVALFNVSDFVRKSRFSSLGLAYIASYLRKFSTHNDISIVEGDGMRKLEFLKPDIVGLFSVSQSFNEACAVAGAIKRRYGIPVIVGSYHISALPQTLPDTFDIGVIGEGEETMKELVDVLAASGLDRERLRSVRGIAFRDTDGRVRVTPERGYIRDLDSIPLPARDLQEPSAFPSIITSRGCPYRCIFCSSVKYWGAPRFHSPG
ncbi:MAG TPA: cobalamin-dependent protein [Candidatus Omnitrophota bacterium]|nr:cobalamin-dependent protein [Candidatus Omnitrophota bacterium]